ncbi:hypothetical protein GGI26_004708 [Coemansia sp. RSA 1358]|uniref:Uncharacterized protein n=1 Tax=Coemansia umbellata TaxID=1424467 RepID=A0ABQ8PJS6_9FUNG|nr:hypothetical protein EDC05_004047 [Coemansia umbellata]KAJ2620812.1 hypothetical protein GGI26_004708 [Coemansia sp. RSA 1358]
MRSSVQNTFSFLRASINLNFQYHGTHIPKTVVSCKITSVSVYNRDCTVYRTRRGAFGVRGEMRFSTRRDQNGTSGEKNTTETKRNGSKDNIVAMRDGDSKSQNSALPDFQNTNRAEMLKGIRILNTDMAWTGFDGILSSNGWSLLTEEDITRLLHLFNDQFSFERNEQALDRAKFIVNACEQNGMIFKLSWGYNEVIRLLIYQGHRDEAYKVKANLEAGRFGPDAIVNVHTYTAFFNDPYINSDRDIVRLTSLYDEMLSRNIEPDTRIKKAFLIRVRKAKKQRLLAALLESTNTKDIPYTFSTFAARIIGAKAKGLTSIFKPGLAYEELQKLFSYQIPRDTRQIPANYASVTREGEVDVPLQYSRTREAFFVYLRSAYESLIRIRLSRKQPKIARELLEDMRRNSYLPPTLKTYAWFFRYHSKRKDINQLREIYEIMLQDGVQPTEYFYTKIITACMFTPKRRLLKHFTNKAVQNHLKKQPDYESMLHLDEYLESNASCSKSNSLNQQPISRSTILSPGLPDVPRDEILIEEINSLVYNPKECIRFFEDMLSEYGASGKPIYEKSYIPNIHITNAVMRAYLMLERPLIALREFSRYCYHQKQLYPTLRPVDVDLHRGTVAFVFKMALDAAKMRNDEIRAQKIYNIMLEWGVKLPNSDPSSFDANL